MTTILQLLFPIFCIVCSDPGQEVCDQCALEIAPGKYHRSIAGLSVWCGALYGDGLSQIILLAKEQNNLAARNFLADLVVQSLVARIEQASYCVNQGILVPIPSSAKATRVRGYRHAYELAMLVARKISKEPRLKASDVRVMELLEVNRKIQDQSGLNRYQRRENLAGAYSPQLPKGFSPDLVRSGHIFLLDDLVTTGNSLIEGARALSTIGLRVDSAICAGVGLRPIS